MRDSNGNRVDDIWGGVTVRPGEGKEVSVIVSESFAGVDIRIPVFVWRGREAGPNVFVTAAVHGDEINGTGAIRHIIAEEPVHIRRGTLVLVPVVNILGFERHSRYLPDRRDLNRCFPGTEHGSLARRMARAIFDEIVRRCDYGIDFHTAAIRRTNFPNVRANMADEKLAAFARAFGAELIVSSQGPKGSLRRAACKAGCPTLILEAGEVWKVESPVVEYAVRGVKNCLSFLGMIDEPVIAPAYRFETDTTRWVRAMRGGFLQFHVTPGTVIEEGEPIATNTSLTGQDQHVIESPIHGIVLGMTTLPSVAPGDPVCHIAFSKHGTLKRVERAVRKLDDDSLHERMREDLARSLHVSERNDDGKPEQH